MLQYLVTFGEQGSWSYSLATGPGTPALPHIQAQYE